VSFLQERPGCHCLLCLHSSRCRVSVTIATAPCLLTRGIGTHLTPFSFFCERNVNLFNPDYLRAPAHLTNPIAGPNIPSVTSRVPVDSRKEASFCKDNTLQDDVVVRGSNFLHAGNPYWGFSWYSSVLSGNCHDSTVIRPLQFPSKPRSICYSSTRSYIDWTLLQNNLILQPKVI
jgi:hypothetical protein